MKCDEYHVVYKTTHAAAAADDDLGDRMKQEEEEDHRSISRPPVRSPPNWFGHDDDAERLEIRFRAKSN